MLYSVILLLMTLWEDVEWERSRESYSELSSSVKLGILIKIIVIAQDAAACAQEFHANTCVSPIPFLKEQCTLWKICMNSDASHIAKTKVIVCLVAELLSELVEGFFGRLSWKTCVSLKLVELLQRLHVSCLSDVFLLHFCVQELEPFLIMAVVWSITSYCKQEYHSKDQPIISKGVSHELNANRIPASRKSLLDTQS